MVPLVWSKQWSLLQLEHSHINLTASEKVAVPSQNTHVFNAIPIPGSRQTP